MSPDRADTRSGLKDLSAVGLVEADRLVLAQDGTVVLDVAADVLAVIECGTVGRLSRLRALHPNHGKPWSEGEVSEFRQLFTDGVGAADLAQAMCENNKDRPKSF